jgi:serine/threonine protein kinase
MSPEQCRGDPIDRRSDVFALGIVLHELVTGQKLFQGDNDYAIIRKIVESDAPRLADVVPGDYPDELERIVARALARDRDARYASAQDLQVDLEAFSRAHRLDGSAMSRARLLRQMFGTPPAGVDIEPPAIAIVSDEGASASTTTTPQREDKTESTALETPASRNSAATHARKRWLTGAAVIAVLIAGSAGAWIALRGTNEATAVPGDATSIASPPADTAAASTAHRAAPPIDAATVTAPPADAGVDAGRAPIRPKSHNPGVQPQPALDPCKGWDPNSFEPPPEGCTPHARARP